MKYVASNYVPRNKRVLIVEPEAIKKVGGLYIPEGSQERPNIAQIDAMDPLINVPINEGGAGENFKVGDKIMYHKGAGIPFNLNGKDVRLLHVNEILMSYDEAPAE